MITITARKGDELRDALLEEFSGAPDEVVGYIDDLVAGVERIRGEVKRYDDYLDVTIIATP